MPVSTQDSFETQETKGVEEIPPQQVTNANRKLQHELCILYSRKLLLKYRSCFVIAYFYNTLAFFLFLTELCWENACWILNRYTLRKCFACFTFSLKLPPSRSVFVIWNLIPFFLFIIFLFMKECILIWKQAWRMFFERRTEPTYLIIPVRQILNMAELSS